ncbi:MAG TPA: ATP-binding cassette domain-containing protein [Acidimicrobiales bacterium]
MADRVSDRPLLEGRGLVKRYGGVVAVNSADIVLSGGEILGLVGPNGAGKTTLVDLVSGIQAADGGTLTLAGRPLGGPPSRRARAGLARTFQYPQLALDLTVRQNLALGRTARRNGGPLAMLRSALAGVVGSAPAEDEAAVEAIAREVRVGDIDRRCRDLTLGEQRLVEVARALIQDPLVMLLDEPFAGADANGVAGISEAIRDVRARGHGVILVDHNVDLVASLVDRIMLLDQGRVVFDGDPVACLRSEEMQRVYFGTRAGGGAAGGAAADPTAAGGAAKGGAADGT